MGTTTEDGTLSDELGILTEVGGKGVLVAVGAAPVPELLRGGTVIWGADDAGVEAIVVGISGKDSAETGELDLVEGAFPDGTTI